MNFIKNWPHYPIIFLLIVSKIYWTPDLSWWVITLPLWYWIAGGILMFAFVFCAIAVDLLKDYINRSSS